MSNGSVQRYPVDEFPPVLENVINTLHEQTQAPVELIGSAVLAAASLACQSVAEIIPPFASDAIPCSLYFLTIADSGERKTTINNIVMKPFHDFTKEAQDEYDVLLSKYDIEYSSWETKLKAYKNNVTRSIRKGYEAVFENENLIKHLQKKPIKPVLINILYEDSTLKGFVEGLSECPMAGVITDEAISFLKGRNKESLGLLNKAWDGGTYSLRRAKDRPYYIRPCLTFSLMCQSGVFDEYLYDKGTIQRDSGFLSRFLFTKVNSTIGNRANNYNYDDNSVNNYYKVIRKILSAFKNDFGNEYKNKTQISLSDESKKLWFEFVNEVEQKIAPEEKANHMKDIASKAGSNVLRLVTILSIIDHMSKYVDNSIEFEKDEDSNRNEIHHKNLSSSITIMRWYLNQADKLFFPMSERYQFEKDVRELHQWLSKWFQDNNCGYIMLSELYRRAPGRMREKEKITPILDQLISQNYCGVFSAYHSSAQYICVYMGNNLYGSIPNMVPGQLPIPIKTFQHFQNNGIVVNLI